MVDAPASQAFVAVRANQGNANSDIIFGDQTVQPHVDYATILADPAGPAWAVLVARAGVSAYGSRHSPRPSTVAATSSSAATASVATGVPADQVGTAWRGAEFAAGTVRTDRRGRRFGLRAARDRP